MYVTEVVHESSSTALRKKWVFKTKKLALKSAEQTLENLLKSLEKAGREMITKEYGGGGAWCKVTYFTMIDQKSGYFRKIYISLQPYPMPKLPKILTDTRKVSAKEWAAVV